MNCGELRWKFILYRYVPYFLSFALDKWTYYFITNVPFTFTCFAVIDVLNLSLKTSCEKSPAELSFCNELTYTWKARILYA